MPFSRWPRLGNAAILALLAAASASAFALTLASGRADADTVVLKNGIVYRGVIDRDNTLVYVFDGLKRIVLYDSKIARIESDAPTFRTEEVFKIEQPLVVHGGAMPKEVLGVKAEPWSNKGRRLFQYISARANKPIRMEQAINEMGPHIVRVRGVDGFWQGLLGTNEVPREVILAILAKVEQTNQNERLRVARFLIQAAWYKEAKAELEALIHDFPDLRDRAENALASVVQLETTQLNDEIEVRRRAQQYRDVLERLRTFPTRDTAPDLVVAIREKLRNEEAQAAADKDLAGSLRGLADRLSNPIRDAWQKALLEVIQALGEAPDAVRDRLSAWQKAQAAGTGDDAARFALAMSGYIVGADAAVTDLEAASNYWKARDLVQEYLSSRNPVARSLAVEKLGALPLPADPAQAQAQPEPIRLLDVIARLALRMPPPLHDGDGNIQAGEPKLHRVQDDDNAAPTEYAVLLPPEYHPLRTYPAVVALHSGGGPQSAVAWWKAEAQRRGYIVIAPEYNLPGQPHDYRFTASEHAAVELALRDAKRRYSIDDDRVFVGGSLIGGQMAWDFGLAHPDLFAGVASVSGLPGKYVFRTLAHADWLPLYVALGDLAPASNELVYGELLKPLIAKAEDVTYVEYFRRGLEDLPGEDRPIFDWMDRRRREPFPRRFDVVSARECDNRFFGVVIREFVPGRTTAPEAVDAFGKNIRPATLKMTSSRPSNLLSFDADGIKRMDIWISPRQLDLKRKLEVKVNKKTYYKQVPRLNPEQLLEDLRLRGDRQQIYWIKIAAG
jgi:pimeloyl-ACP methyl ester carboxylesterase